MIEQLIVKYEKLYEYFKGGKEQFLNSSNNSTKLSIKREDLLNAEWYETKSDVYQEILQDLKELKEQTITYKDCIGVNTNGQRF